MIATDSIAPRPDSLVPPGRAANLAKAVEYLNKGVDGCRETGYREALVEFSGYLSKALARQGDYKGALAAYQMSKETQDSVFSTANNEKITTLETKRALRSE